MLTTIDGLTSNDSLNPEQIRALAYAHRQKLGEALYHAEDHIGNIGISQRAEISKLTQSLGLNEKNEFYRLYNQALYEFAQDDAFHPPHAHEHVNIFLYVVVLALIAGVLYFVFVHHITH